MKHLPDCMIIAGLASLGYGLWLFCPWVAFAVCGALVLSGGVLMARAEDSTGDEA